jgi:hypothetical protein
MFAVTSIVFVCDANDFGFVVFVILLREDELAPSELGVLLLLFVVLELLLVLLLLSGMERIWLKADVGKYAANTRNADIVRMIIVNFFEFTLGFDNVNIIRLP